MRDVYVEVEALKAEGMTATKAFKAFAERHGISASKAAADYYKYVKGLKPQEPERLSSRLRTIASEVEDLEVRQDQIDALVSKLK